MSKENGMENSLMLYSAGQAAVPMRDRGVARRAKDVYDEARLTAMKNDGVLAVTGHAMEGLTQLHQLRQHLAGDDPMLNAILGEIEVGAVMKVKNLTGRMFNGWSL